VLFRPSKLYKCYDDDEDNDDVIIIVTSGYATWFTAGGAICIVHYDVTDDVITRKL